METFLSKNPEDGDYNQYWYSPRSITTIVGAVASHPCSPWIYVMCAVCFIIYDACMLSVQSAFPYVIPPPAL